MNCIKYKVFDGMEIHDVQMIDFQNKIVYWLFRGCLQNQGSFDEVVLLQFTGLIDGEGNEIYYGDIVRYEGWIYVVLWDEDNSGFYLADHCYLDDSKHEEHLILSCVHKGVKKGNFYVNDVKSFIRYRDDFS